MASIGAPAGVPETAIDIETTVENYGLEIDVGTTDGNCQFAAIAKGINVDNLTAKEVRKAIAEKLRTDRRTYEINKEDWDDNSNGDFGRDYDDYVKHIQNDGAWGGLTTLQAASEVYHTCFIVIGRIKDNTDYELVLNADYNGDTNAWFLHHKGIQYQLLKYVDSGNTEHPSLVIQENEGKWPDLLASSRQYLLQKHQEETSTVPKKVSLCNVLLAGERGGPRRKLVEYTVQTDKLRDAVIRQLVTQGKTPEAAVAFVGDLPMEEFCV